jgi:polysaccharide export outer membrane protein
MGLSRLGAQQDPLLKPDDTVRMSVYGETDLTTQTRVLKSGEASFPLVGLVKIGGLTVGEATTKLHDLYAADYLVDPKVALTIEVYAAEFASVVGAVASPGQVPIPSAGKVDLAAVLAAAGGLNATADTSRITLVRVDGESSDHSLQSIQANGGPQVRAGDRVITYASPFAGKMVTIRGQVRRPGPLGLPLDGRLDIITALTLAGDFTDLANPKKITLSRKGRNIVLNFRELTAQGAQKLYLQPDDVVDVAERVF